jgi:hypothetical protein
LAVSLGIVNAPRRRLARAAQGLPDAVGGGAHEEHLGARLVGVPALLGDLHLGALRVGVEHDRADVERRDAVHEGVMGLGEVGVAVALEALDQVELPEGPGEIERLLHGSDTWTVD